LCLCLTLLLAMVALAGCGNNEPAATNSSTESSAPAETSAPDENDADTSAPSENTASTEVGNDSADDAATQPAQNQVAQNTEPPQHAEYTDEVSYVLDENLRKFHTKDCSEVAAIANPVPYTGTRADLENEGYEPCTICNP
ncbi:MAG: hypothetical protein Q4C56_09670, partial [Peptococcaceae bacterium]|nr:hypothetical protein [Peptococcaceae bacterium]